MTIGMGTSTDLTQVDAATNEAVITPQLAGIRPELSCSPTGRCSPRHTRSCRAG